MEQYSCMASLHPVKHIQYLERLTYLKYCHGLLVISSTESKMIQTILITNFVSPTWKSTNEIINMYDLLKNPSVTSKG